MSTLDLEQVDLAALARAIAARVQGPAREGSVAGRTEFRDAVIETLSCSELEAEQLVDTLVARGYLVFDPTPPGMWDVRPDAG